MRETGTEYAAHCDCGAFGVSTAGTNWGKHGLIDLARTHLRNCRAETPPETIDIVQRSTGSGAGAGADEDADGPAETVVETVTREVLSA